jgi:hypothetical protein
MVDFAELRTHAQPCYPWGRVFQLLDCFLQKKRRPASSTRPEFPKTSRVCSFFFEISQENLFSLR